MSTNKLTPLEVVKRYHERYLEYEGAFNKTPFTNKDIEKDVLEVVNSDIDIDSSEFVEKMFSAIDEKTSKREDVNSAAYKFVFYTDFYLMTQEEDLPEKLLKDYDNLTFVKDSLKESYSIKDGEFVENSKKSIPPERVQYYKEIHKQIKLQLGTN